MPRIRQPESDEGRLFVLKKAMTVGPLDRAAGRNYLPEALITSIGTFVNDQTTPPVAGHATKVHLVATGRAAWLKETGESQTGWEVAEMWLRDFWEVLKRRTTRLGHSPSVLAFFELPADGSLPPLDNREEIETWCQKAIDGDAAAVAAGNPLMANPSAAELGVKLGDARREAGEVLEPSRALEQRQRDVQAERPRAIFLMEEVLAELRHSTRNLAPGDARDVMRSYGFQFDYDPGETPDPVTPPPTPPPTP